METIISMGLSSVNLLIIGLALVAIIISAYYHIDGFYSEPGTKGCDSSCSHGGYSKITGKPCCNTGNDSVDNNDIKCITLPNGNKECYNAGPSDDDRGSRTGNVSSWDGNAAGDAGRLSASLGAGDSDLEVLADLTLPFLGSYNRGSGSSDNDDEDEISKEDLELIQGSRWYSGRPKDKKWWKDYKNKNKNKPKTVDELINEFTKEKDVPGIGEDSKDKPEKDKCKTDDETLANLLDNRLQSCKKLEKRFLELPSKEEYNKGASKGHDSCNKYKSLTTEEEEDTCEGFSPLL